MKLRSQSMDLALALNRVVHSRRLQRGMGLIEALVGLAVGLVVALSVFQVYATWDGRQRTSVAKAEGLSQGALAAYLLERDLQQAGWGLSNVGGAANCPLQGVTPFNAGGVGSPVLLPVQIRNLGNNDDLVILYGNAALRTLHAGIASGGVQGSTLTLRTGDSGGFLINDRVLLHNVGNVCTLGGAITQVNNTTDQIVVDGLPPTNVDTLLNMGPAPSLNHWSVMTQTGNNVAGASALFLQNRAPAAPQPQAAAMADGIVGLQAQYGVTDGLGGIIWQPRAQTNVTNANANFDWTTVVAIRFGILSRNEQFEAPVNGVSVTPNQPAWIGGAFGVANIQNLQGPTAVWNNYRYQVNEGVVALRNSTWGQRVPQ
jgi:type IV pilus assembly protein PilW